jgi:hypothetical protein
MPVDEAVRTNWVLLSLSSSLMGCLSDRFIFNIGYRKNIMLEFRQAVKKQP